MGILRPYSGNRVSDTEVVVLQIYDNIAANQHAAPRPMIYVGETRTKGGNENGEIDDYIIPIGSQSNSIITGRKTQQRCIGGRGGLERRI